MRTANVGNREPGTGSTEPVGGRRTAGSASALAVAMMAVFVSACSSSNQAPAAPAASAAQPAGPPMVVGKAPAGAIVTLEPAPPRTVPMPEAPAVMDQYGKQFVPGELFVRVGQPVEFRNTEDQAHNVIVRRSESGANIFHVSTDPSDKYVHTFDRPGRYDVSCDLHLGMSATIVATTSPYFAIADANGDFTIRNLEAGSYKLTALTGGQNLERAIDVAGPRTEVTVGR